MMDTNDDGEVSLDEFETFLDNMFECNGKARTNLKAHTGGNGKKKLNKNEASVLFKKLLSKASEDDEGEDDEGEEDVCDKEVQKGFFDEIDADQSGEISKEELIDFVEGMCEEDGEPAEDCAEDAEHLYDMLDENGDGEVSLDEFETFLDNMFGCGCNGKARTNLKAHTGGNGKKKLKKKLKAIKKKIKASEKVAEAKERAHAAAARKAAKEQEDG